uniref:Toll-like receptor 21 n=1 Tax=Eptatretus burgeri TaxID=7764 RepID=A0A8C4Q199_EPTBU
MKQQVLLLFLLPLAIRGYALRKCVQYYGNSSFVNCEKKGLEYINVTLENLPNNSTIYTVSYAYNKIKEIEGYIFSKLTALHNLTLNHNKIANISLNAFHGLSNLVVLDISANKLSCILHGTFKNLKNLMTLDLSRNKILLPDTFQDLSNLRMLDISQNKFKTFTEVTDSIRSLYSLSVLNVQKNYFSTFNLISDMSWMSHTDLNNLAVLNVSGNPLQVRDFFNLQNKIVIPQNLLNLTLDYNYLKTLSIIKADSNLSLQHLSNLKTFYSMKSLKILDLGGNRVKEIKTKAFHGLTNLKKLYLDRNRLTRLDYRWFAHLKNLNVLDLAINELHFHYGESISPFRYLRHLSMLKIYSQQKEGMEFIPKNFFNGLHFLHILYIQNNKLTALQADTLAPLTSLRILYISEECTGLRALSVDFFKPLAKLNYLDLSNIGLSRIQYEQFQNNTALHTLFLEKNALSFVYEGSLDSLKSLRYIDLSKNQLRCTCANAWFKNWAIYNKTVQVVDLYEYRCDTPGAPDRPYFVDFDISICYESLLGVKLLEFTGVAVLFTLLGPLAYIKGHWHLKYNYYLFRARFRQFRKKDCEASQRYDAFVSYNSSDEDWVMNYLRPNLEQHGPPFYKLCLHHRDFELGRYIIDNIIDGIYSSRKTICLLSESYLRSDWCSMEVQMAMHRLFNEHKDVLIMVLLEDLPGYWLRTTDRLSRVLGQRTYIVWPEDETAQQLFWAKLRSALRDPTKRWYYQS